MAMVNEARNLFSPIGSRDSHPGTHAATASVFNSRSQTCWAGASKV
jgi:hypothetical protein